MAKRIISLIRIFLIVAALLSIVFHIGLTLELGLDIKYGVYWISPDTYVHYSLYAKLHIMFMLIVIVYLIFENKGGRIKSDSTLCHKDSNASNGKN